jgi:hypothetical protein
MSDYELLYLVASVDVLEQYLISQELYWLPGIQARKGENPYPSLTPGNILIARIRASVLIQTESEHQQFVQVTNKLDNLTFHWKAAWSKKVTRDFQARLNLWRDYLQEYREKPDINYDRYPYEVNRRVQLEILRQEPNEIRVEDREMLSSMDNLLKAFFIPGKFLWELVLEESFPHDIYWYLYGSLNSSGFLSIKEDS